MGSYSGREEAGEVHLPVHPSGLDDLLLDTFTGHRTEGIELVFRWGEKQNG